MPTCRFRRTRKLRRQRRPFATLRMPTIGDLRGTRQGVHLDGSAANNDLRLAASHAAVGTWQLSELPNTTTNIGNTMPTPTLAIGAWGPGAVAVLATKVKPRSWGAPCSPGRAKHYDVAVSTIPLAASASLILRLSIINVLVCRVGCTCGLRPSCVLSFVNLTTASSAVTQAVPPHGTSLERRGGISCRDNVFSNPKGTRGLLRRVPTLKLVWRASPTVALVRDNSEQCCGKVTVRLRLRKQSGPPLSTQASIGAVHACPTLTQRAPQGPLDAPEPSPLLSGCLSARRKPHSPWRA